MNQQKQNILVIDDTSDAISYQKSKIDSTFNYRLNIEQLYQIFKENNNDIYCYDTTDAISFIDENNNEISLHQWDPEAMSANLLKITTPQLKETGNEIFLYAPYKHNAKTGMQWENIENEDMKRYFSKTVSGDIVTNDIYGYENTQKILNLHKKKSHFPAAEYCDSQKIILGNSVYHGYLPAIGQLYILHKYLSMINYVLKNAGAFTIDAKTGEILSSTEESKHSVYGYYLMPGTATKNKGHTAFPFFKKIS